MKTIETVSKHIFGASMLLALALAALQPLSARAAEEKPMKPMKGGEHILMLKEVKTKQDADSLTPSDTVAMVCSKCKTVWLTRAKQGTKRAQVLAEGDQPQELIGTHACASCNSTLTVVGVRKGTHTELKHICKMCGDDSAFYYATKIGSDATAGMDKK